MSDIKYVLSFNNSVDSNGYKLLITYCISF